SICALQSLNLSLFSWISRSSAASPERLYKRIPYSVSQNKRFQITGKTLFFTQISMEKNGFCMVQCEKQTQSKRKAIP
ncbi:MAG: hypothetical protein LBM60_07310, partial [Clostridium sp.]|nr:hypothetical protein [Clostridium sp.]